MVSFNVTPEIYEQFRREGWRTKSSYNIHGETYASMQLPSRCCRHRLDETSRAPSASSESQDASCHGRPMHQLRSIEKQTSLLSREIHDQKVAVYTGKLCLMITSIDQSKSNDFTCHLVNLDALDIA